MAQRARGSYPLFRRYMDEFAEFQVKALVKLGVQVDGGSATDREHLWFQAARLDDGAITGTLLNEPWHIAALKAGESYTYDVDVLTDWAVFTPAGRITPAEGAAARTLRADREKVLKAMREHAAGE